MPTVRQLLEAQTTQAIQAVGGTAHPAVVKPTADPKFGDYQANGIMALAKSAGQNPRRMAEDVAARLDPATIPATWEIAGPGFINFRLDPDWLGRTLLTAALDERLGVEAAAAPETVVIDFSAPNVAKSMHVGHIRSTILGDALARVLRFLGHTVVTDNHLGDWGTQFGLLIVGSRESRDPAAYARDPLAEMERIYRATQTRAQTDTGVAERARRELAKLQQGDADNTALWTEFMQVSRRAFERLYARLGVDFDHWLGESFYNPMLADVVRDLREREIARISDGAVCVFFDDADLADTPFLIQKQDGAFLYATTDLATIKYRVETFRPDRIVYVTDSRQRLHFRQLFTTVRRWGYDATLEHVWFGTILGNDGTPIKTREGEPIKLAGLLDEAERRALEVVRTKNPHLSAAEQARVAQVVGIGAVKYADLMQNRTADYRFGWDKLLALDGNTAPYLQYAYARIRSIFRKGGLDDWHPDAGLTVRLEAPEELALAKQMIRFGDVLLEVERAYKPNLLATFLYELATRFNLFYQSHSVLKAPAEQRATRLLLSALTAGYLHTGLDLLGIETVDAM